MVPSIWNQPTMYLPDAMAILKQINKHLMLTYKSYNIYKHKQILALTVFLTKKSLVILHFFKQVS